MRLSTFKRIIKEDFPSQYQTLIDKLAYPINLMFDSFTRAMNNNISFADNIAAQIKDVTVKVDSNGIPTTKLQFTSTLNSKSQGMWCALASNNDTANPSAVPTGGIFLTFTEQNSLITISNITGLPANVQFTLRLISIQ